MVAADLSSGPLPLDADAHCVRASEGMGGLAKGLAIIEAFASNASLSVADAARHSATSRAAARRCLLTLVALGYVELVGQRFQPLAKLRQLGQFADPRKRLAAIAQPHLKAARERLQESVSLAVLEGDHSLFIARAEARHIVSIGVKIGASLPVYCSATGRVLLSGLSKQTCADILARFPLERRTAHTRVRMADVLAAVKNAGTAGFSLNDQELEIGMRSLAVPIYDVESNVIASLSVSTSTARTKVVELQRRFVPVLRTTADAIRAAVQQYTA